MKEHRRTSIFPRNNKDQFAIGIENTNVLSTKIGMEMETKYITHISRC
jgi:hypothetical protein